MWIQKIKQQSILGLSFVNDYLDMSQINKEIFKPIIETFNLRELLHEIKSMFDEKATSLNIKLIVFEQKSA